VIAAPLLATFALACAGPDPMATALRLDPAATTLVWSFTSAGPPWIWTRAAQPLAAEVGSLGLGESDGRLILVGLPMADKPSHWDEWFPSLRVRGWVGRAGLRLADVADPSAWTPSTWSIADPDAISALDPQPFEGGFWYYAARGAEGDPAAFSGAHAIRSSPPPQVRLSANGLADPSPVRFHGKVLLFATAWPDSVVLAAGEPLTIQHRFPGLSVPFAAVVPEGGQDALWLVAQAVVAGKRQPVLARSADGLGWSEPAPMLDLGDLQSCTSPVLGAVSGGLALFCVEERAR